MLAGYSLGEADLLRRAMGKKIRAEMEKQRARFVEGAVENNGVERAQAETIFELLAKFADYGFNKSHAAAYALVVLPDRLSEGELPGRVHRGLDDARHRQHRQARRISRRGAAARHQGRGAQINRSGATFEVGDSTIYYALAALKGVGVEAVKQIVAERKKGAFTSLADFASRSVRARSTSA